MWMHPPNPEATASKHAITCDLHAATREDVIHNSKASPSDLRIVIANV